MGYNTYRLITNFKGEAMSERQFRWAVSYGLWVAKIQEHFKYVLERGADNIDFAAWMEMIDDEAEHAVRVRGWIGGVK